MLKKSKLKDAGLRLQYVQQNNRLQIYYAKADRPVLEELVAAHSGRPVPRPVSAGPSVVDLLCSGA